MTTYSLLKAGKGRKTRKKGTHLDCFLTALKGLGGKATAAQVIDYCTEHRMLRDTEMDLADAIRWIAAYSVRLGLCSAKEVS